MMIFDYEGGDFIHTLSDSMAMDVDGNLMMKLSDNMVIDMASGDIHMISSWPSDAEKD